MHLARDPFSSRSPPGTLRQPRRCTRLAHELGDGIVPIPGATRIETASSIRRALDVELDEQDRLTLDARFSGRLLRMRRAERRPARTRAATSSIVMEGSARERRRSPVRWRPRDTSVSTVTRSVARWRTSPARTSSSLRHQRIVLEQHVPDAQVAQRGSRDGVAAGRSGFDASGSRTDVANAQINASGACSTCTESSNADEIRQRSRKDPRYLLPDAQFRYERTAEPRRSMKDSRRSTSAPSFARTKRAQGRALILDFDDLIKRGKPVLDWRDVSIEQTRRDLLGRYRRDGWFAFVHAWRPQVERKRRRSRTSIRASRE